MLIETFYGKIQRDLLLGTFFEMRIRDWPRHLHKMHSFWQTILLNEHTYSGTPFAPHAYMGLSTVHFARWLELWNESINLQFEGAKADEAKRRGELMASVFLSKIEFLKSK